MKKTAKDNQENHIASGVEPGVLTMREVSVKSAGRSLSSLYSVKRELLLEPFAELVYEGLLRASMSSSPKVAKAMGELHVGDGLRRLTEGTMTQLYNSFWGDIRNVAAVAKVDKRYADAWRRLITSLEVSSMDIARELGRDIRIAYSYGWHSTVFTELLFSHLSVISTWQMYSRTERDYMQFGMLSMQASTRRVLSDLFFGKEFREPQLVDTLPEGAGLLIDTHEHSMATDLMILDGIALNGWLLSDNGSISAATVKKVKKQTNLTDFAAPTTEEMPDRVEMLCLTYFTLLARQKEKPNPDMTDMARFAVGMMPDVIAGPMFNTFLPAFQGFTKTWTSTSYAPEIVASVAAIVMEAADRWMNLDNFKMQLLCSVAIGETNYYYLQLFSERERDKSRLVRRADKSSAADPKPIEWFEDVALKFAIHWLRYLCALGMAEIACDATAQPDDPMEGMRFIRLTPLGRYAFKIDSEYTPKAAEKQTNVEFDPRNGIITIDDKSPFQMFLSNIAKRISPTRFRISEDTLLKGCRMKAELEQRIKNLKVIIDPKEHPDIQKIIDEALRHTDCAERDGGYTLIRLRPDLPGLREAILTNFELRQMTILAGPSLALVKTHKMDRFNAILAAYGYLME